MVTCDAKPDDFFNLILSTKIQELKIAANQKLYC